MLAASAVNAVTSATPIKTGAAVLAVRLGLRAAFCCDIEPVTPRRAETGLPSNIATGFESAGPITRTPAKTPSTPRPKIATSAPFIEAKSPTAPAPINTSPIVTRRVSF